MTGFLAYLYDRRALLAGALVGGLVLIGVLRLVAPFSWADVLYALLLAAVAVALAAVLDYARQREFRDELRHAAAATKPNEGLAVVQLPPAATLEQGEFATLLAAVQSRALTAIQTDRRSVEEHRVFTDLWAHQMKTPLAVLAVTAAQQDDTDEWRSVVEETDKLLEGVELLLTTARLDRFELDLAPTSVDLTQLARAEVNALRRSFLRRGVYPSVTGPAEPVLVSSDPKWLSVVLRQLLTNAIKYSNEGGRVAVTVSSTASGARLAVRDEGLGVLPEEAPRLFDKFFTGVNGRAVGSATGMGLHLASEVSRRLGHVLTFEQPDGPGAEFVLTFVPGGTLDLARD